MRPPIFMVKYLEMSDLCKKHSANLWEKGQNQLAIARHRLGFNDFDSPKSLVKGIPNSVLDEVNEISDRI